MDPAKPLNAISIALLMLPVAAAIAINLWLHLAQTRRLVIATVRSIIQLLLIGSVIGWVMQHSHWYWVTALLCTMTLIAAWTASGQAGKRMPGLFWRFGLVLSTVTTLVLMYFTQVVIGDHSWNPTLLIPLGGMLLGNAMNAATLASERLGSEMYRNSRDVEVYLSMGATPWQAVHPCLRRAVNAAITPTVNAMLVVGVVKLPGMMTGQLLGGQKADQAALYQFLILVGILFGDIATSTTSCLLLYRRFFTAGSQLNRQSILRWKP